MLNRLKKIIIPLTIAIFLFAPVTPFLSLDNGMFAGLENNVTHAQGINAGDEPSDNDQCAGGGTLGISNAFSWSCIVQRIIEIFIYPMMWVLSIVARLFDYVVGFSISSMAYGKGVPFLLEGWSFIRDVTNIIFVFALLIIAFSYITNSFNINQKKALVTLISIAIIANFSLFFARVVIDAGNLTARVFYQNIEANTVVKENGVDTLTYTTISEAVAKRMNFQRFLASDLYKKSSTDKLSSELNADEASLRLVAGVVLWLALLLLTYVFGSMMFIFIGRIAELWLAMILSPLAIASVAMPKIGRFSFGEYDFGVWLNKLISNSFMAPVFLFFVYLVAIFLELPLFGNVPADLTFGMKIVHILLPIFLVAYILILAKKISMKMATGLAKQVSSGIESTVGLAANLAINKGAFLSRKLGGAAGSRLSTAGARIAASQEGKTGLRARLTRSAGTSVAMSGRKLQTSTFDPRSLRLGAIPTALGDKPTMNIGQAAKGGYEADLRKKEKKRVERAKFMADTLKGKVAKDARDEADSIEDKIKKLNNIPDIKFYNQKAQEVNDNIKKTTEELKELRAQGGKYIDPEKIERLEQEIENLRAEKKEREDDISQYRTELAATLKSTEAQAKWNELVKGDGTPSNPGLYSLLKANRESLDKSKVELEKAENAFQEKQAEIKVKENQIAALNAAPPSEEHKARIEELTKEKKTLEDTQAEFTKAGGVRETKKGEIDAANKNIGDLKTKISQNEGELKTIMNNDKSAGIVTKDDFATFQKRLDDAKKAENQSDKLSRTMSVKESEKENLETQSKKELNQKLAATQNKINGFQGDLSAINKAKGEVKTKDEDGKETTVNELLKKHKTRLGELNREIQTTQEQVLEDLALDAEKHWGEMVDSIFDYTAKGASSLAKRVGVSDKNADRLGKATRTTLGVINSPTRIFNEGASELRTKKANAIRELKPKK